jgi:hypothetical protein
MSPHANVQATEGGLPPGRCIRVASAPRGDDRAATREVSLLLLGLAGLLQGPECAEAQRLLAERRLAARVTHRAGHVAAVLEAAVGAGAAAARGLQPGADPPVQVTRWGATWLLGPDRLYPADDAEVRARATGVLSAAPPSAGARPGGELGRVLQAALEGAFANPLWRRNWMATMGEMVRGAHATWALCRVLCTYAAPG